MQRTISGISDHSTHYTVTVSAETPTEARERAEEIRAELVALPDYDERSGHDGSPEAIRRMVEACAYDDLAEEIESRNDTAQAS